MAFASLRSNIHLAALSGVATAALGAAPALAQSAAQEPASTVGDIVVTAQRREQSLQRTPISVTALTAEALEDRSVETVADVAAYTPNLTFTTKSEPGGADSAQVFIRGVGQQDYLITADPGVGLYLDGVYLGRAAGGVLDLPDVQRVEVLRGPQGTLYGRNTIGGAVNIVSARPQLGRQEGALGLTIGSDERTETEFWANLPAGDDWAFRLSGRTLRRDGYARSTLNDVDYGNDDSYSLRAQALWAPSDAFDALLSIDYRHKDQTTSPAALIGVDTSTLGSNFGLYNAIVRPFVDPGLPSFSASAVTTDPYVTSADDAAYNENRSETSGVALTLSWDGPFGSTVRSVTSYRALHLDFAADNDGVAYDITQTDVAIDQDQLSQELQISGTAGRAEYVGGLFVMTENAEDVTETTVFRGRYAALEQASAEANGNPCGPPYQAPGCRGNPINPNLDVELLNSQALDLTTYAAFLQTDIAVTDALTLTLGGRYSVDEKDYEISVRRRASNTVSVPYTQISDEWSAFTPKAGLSYQFTPEVMAYVSYSQGFKSGTFNGRANASVGVNTVDPEELAAWEAGLKATLFDGRLRANGSIFFNDYSDIQLQFTTSINGASVVLIENAGDAEVYGGELELTATPAEGLDLYLNLGHQSSELVSLSGRGATAGFKLGAELAKSPEWTVQAGAQHRFDLGAHGELSARADYSWTDDFYHQRNEDPLSFQPSYGLLNARLAYRPAHGRWEAAAFGTNLSDEVYYSAIVVGSVRTASGYVARGREWGASLKWLF